MSVLASVTTHRELVENLVVRDIKARYKQSVLGIAWTILNPLAMALIYMLVGYYLLRQSIQIPFVIFSYFGLLFWNLFSSGVTGATESLVAHWSLITKVNLPREVFPLAAVVGKLPDFFFALIGLLPLLLYYRRVPDAGMLLIPLLLLILLVFTAGLGMLCACANLFYRDVRHLVGLILSMWMYLVPNIYPLDRVPERYQPLYLLNPVAAVIESARRLAFPELGPVPWEHVGLAALTASVTLVIGYAVFKRYEPRFAEAI